VESFGTAVINTGGNESLGPPVGGIMFAQPVGSCVKNNVAMMPKIDAE